MKLINDNILVKRITEIERNGILIPITDNDTDIRIGIVTHIGDDCEIEVGMKVFYPHYINKSIDYDGIVLHLMKVSDIMAIVPV
jgi:co-chaperonin GroES (HSP10)